MLKRDRPCTYEMPNDQREDFGLVGTVYCHIGSDAADESAPLIIFGTEVHETTEVKFSALGVDAGSEWNHLNALATVTMIIFWCRAGIEG